MMKAARAHDGASVASVKSKMPGLPRLNSYRFASPLPQITLAALLLLIICPTAISTQLLSDHVSFGGSIAPEQGQWADACLLLAQEEPMTEERYEREELGVNSYTAPSIAKIFEQLDHLRPLPFDRLWRDLPRPAPGGRERQAVIFGQLVADGFLIVEAQRRNLIDDLGRVLIREARGLGVAERVMKHSASLTELGKAGQWPAVRNELVATQADVEQAMIDLRDQKMAHLISLGGWLRGLEISAGAVVGKFSAERASILVQPKVVDYFNEELRTLPPAIANEPLFDHIRATVRTIRDTMTATEATSLPPDAVKTIYQRARDVNLEIAQGK